MLAREQGKIWRKTLKILLKGTAILASALALSGCVTTTSGGSGGTAATMVATQGMAPTATSLRQFPSTIPGGGLQVDANADASFATLINAVRTDAGVTPLTYNANLDAAAQAHSADMVANNYFSHTGLNGSSPSQRAAAAGYTGGTVGENIAQGQRNENQAMNAWINSAPHQENNVRAVFREFGLGVAGSGANTTWTLMFGAQ